ncbi:MAG: glycosyltransferase family 2 protein [Myxococcales bacterium]|nr:MAG: glycosyltransferase family 2 protein [Myxococcales bacterium]
MEKALRKYLDHYAEKEKVFAEHINDNFSDCVIIPAFDEGPAILNALESLLNCQSDKPLCIVVNNAPRGAPDKALQNTAETSTAVQARFNEIDSLDENNSTKLLRFGKGALLLIDRYSSDSALDPKAGVGGARKIGTDLALSLWAQGKLDSKWLHQSDADVAFPSDYFSRARQASSRPQAAALLYPFAHESNAALRYEISLRYYVLGLAYAGSPYAFHTIGSTLAVNPAAYAQVRGFPKRQAAEDFYLLNKLAKVASIEKLAGEPLVLSSRISHRVPFGTGVAVEKIQNEGEDAPKLYHPALFAELREKVQSLANERAVHERFDAFRTLKWMHQGRDTRHSSLPFWHALEQAPFIELGAELKQSGLVALRRYLYDLETMLQKRNGIDRDHGTH